MRSSDPYLRLAIEIIVRAIHDARGSDYPARLWQSEYCQGANEEARLWLRTTGAEWLDILGLDQVIMVEGRNDGL